MTIMDLKPCNTNEYRVWHVVCVKEGNDLNLKNARVMKTTKIILSIALVTLTATSFGQLSNFKEKLFAKRTNTVAIYTANYTNNESRIETWMHDLRSWASERRTNDGVEAPVVAESFVIESADVVYEETLTIENWMSAPFETDVYEEALTLESWMSVPFETGVYEEALNLESWMTSPFETGLVEEEIAIETWMTAAWN